MAVAACAVVTFGLLAVVGHYVAAATRPVRLQVNPHVAMAPHDVRVTIRLVPDAAYRVLRVTADSGDFYRESTWQLDGEWAPRLFMVDWSSFPAGDYAITAHVLDASGHVVVAATDALLLR